MCLAIPSEIIEINEMNATVDVLGARRSINLFLMPDEVAVGDYVLVHAGFAIQKVDEDAALEAIVLVKKLIEEMGDEDDLNPFDPDMPRRAGDFT